MKTIAALYLTIEVCLGQLGPRGWDPRFEGKPLVIRFYTVGQGEPSGFAEFTTAIQLSGFSLNPGNMPTGGIVALFSEDQSDNDVKELLGNSIQTWRYEGAGPYIMRTRVDGIDRLIVDAQGEPLPGAELEIRLLTDGEETSPELVFGIWQTGSDGSVELPKIDGDVTMADVLIDRTGYGTAIAGLLGANSTIKTGLVANGSPAWYRAFRGSVVDPENKPVDGAMVEVDYVRTPGEGLIQRNHVRVLTDKEGRFAAYMAPHEAYHCPVSADSFVPPNSRYAYKITAPTGASYPLCVGEAYNDEETLIRFEKGSFHTFAFHGTSGPILHPNKLRYAAVIGEDNRNRIDGTGLQSGVVLANGTYRGQMQLIGDHGSFAGSLSFEPIEVTEDSPVELVFRLPQHGVTVRGRVVHAITKAPLAGVFICSDGPDGLCEDFSSRQWKILEALPNYPTVEVMASDEVSGILHDTTLVRSDQDGDFELVFGPGREFSRVNVWARDYLPYMYLTRDNTPNDDGVIELGSVPMFPAAVITLSVTSENPQDDYVPNWKVDEPAPPEWAEPILTCVPQQNLWSVFDNGWRSVNTLERRYVPAYVPLAIEIMSSSRKYYDYVIPHQIQLTQGQELDLGSYELKPAVEVPVHVADENGQPYEGAPVRVKTDSAWHVPVNTDANGIASIRLAPNAKGVFAVLSATFKEGVDPVVASTPFSLQDGIVEESPYSIILFRRDAARVFKRGPST